MLGSATTLTESERFIATIREEFPNFRILQKKGDGFSRAIDVALRIVTFGAQHHYLSHYHTVIGDTLYVPASWEQTPEVDRVILLRHELVHLRQRRRYGLVVLAFLYFIPFFPLGLAYGRARLEWEAYVETIRATAELRGLDAAHSAALRGKIVGRFTGGAYGWMWPFESQVQRWYDQALAELDSNRPPAKNGTLV